MGIAEIMREVRKLPDDELLALAAQVDEEAAKAVDHRFECLVRDGRFEDLASEALREEKEAKTIPLHEVLNERGVS
jgi:ferritin-like protein